MKVVYDAALFPGLGGGPLHFVGLAAALARKGDQVVHVLPRASAVADGQLDGEVVRLVAPGNRVMRQATFEVARVALILWWWVRGRRFDLWISRQSLVGVGLYAARLVANRVVVEINGPLREEILANQGSAALAAAADFAFGQQLRACHVALPVTPGLADYTRERNGSVEIEVLPNGADIVEAEFPWQTRPRDLVFVGALTPWYELETVLYALAAERDAGRAVTFDVLGDGVRHSSLVQLVDELELGDLVKLHGWSDPTAVLASLAASKVGVLPLRPKNPDIFAVGSPLKLYEYAAAGLRVIGTDYDGISNSPVANIVDYYGSGDRAACAEAMRAALSSAPPLVNVDDWSWDGRARQITQLVAGQA